MQSCASAAKLRSGGPILPIGMKAKGLAGNPPPRTVIGIPSQAYERGRNCRGTLSVLQSLCRTQNDAVGYNALPHEPPQSDQRSEEHTSELQSHSDLVCRLLLEKKNERAHKPKK